MDPQVTVIDLMTAARSIGVQHGPRPEHEELARTIRTIMQDLMETAQATMGTVVGEDGGNVTVHFDSETGPRQVGFPKQRGQRYTNGDRVHLHRLRGGDWFVGGGVSGRAGRDPVVGKDHMEENSVDNEILHGSVVNNINNAQSTANSAQGDARNAQQDANGARNRADDAYTRAGDAQNTASDAKDIASSGKNKLSGKKFKTNADGEISLPSW